MVLREVRWHSTNILEHWSLSIPVHQHMVHSKKGMNMESYRLRKCIGYGGASSASLGLGSSHCLCRGVCVGWLPECVGQCRRRRLGISIGAIAGGICNGLQQDCSKMVTRLHKSDLLARQKINRRECTCCYESAVNSLLVPCPFPT